MNSLSIVLPTKAEAGNLPWLIPRLKEVLEPKVSALEIIVIDYPTGDGTDKICEEHGVRYIGENLGFADALKRGFKEAKNELVATMDSDGSHDPVYISWMLREIENCDLVIGSRYVPRGGQVTSLFRYVTSRILNIWVGSVCSMPVLDLSGGFKMYRKEIFQEIELESSGFEIQCEIAIKTYGHGFRVREVPFTYHPRVEGRSKAAILKYGMAFLFGSLRLRRYRNSRAFCDYDERAYKSRWPFQRFWQRRRVEIIQQLLPPTGPCLDVGCGSASLIMGHTNVVGVDSNRNIVRYLTAEPRQAICASAEALPIQDEEFEKVYCCETLEYLSEDTAAFAELARVTKKGGRLLVTTPDYGGIMWPMLKSVYKIFVADPPAHEHKTRYNAKSIREKLESAGFKLIKQDRMCGSILFLLLEKQ